MNNIKGLAIATDGAMKRMAITYDTIDEQGKIINSNVRMNRLITDNTVLDAINILESYASELVNNE